MKLQSFRIRNYRSIADTGDIDVSRITALLGRNESGKSNVLRALHSLNPVEGFGALKPIKDFPRHRKITDCTETTPVVDSTWELSPKDQEKLAEIYPATAGITHVKVGRYYGGKTRWVGLNVTELPFNINDIKADARKIDAAVRAKAEKLEAAAKAALCQAADRFTEAVSAALSASKWAAATKPACAALRQALATADVELSEATDQKLVSLEDRAEEIPQREAQHTAARTFIIENLPKFMFLEDYPEISGHQNIGDFINRKTQGTQSPADVNFEKLCKVAGLDPHELQTLAQEGGQETRSQLANRAGAVVTKALRGRWKDRQLKVRFNLDGQHFDTLVSDPNNTYDVEVNLNERSRGFQWFFAFYVVFAADTEDGAADGAILLLDEPGLYLHARSQGDLLQHLEADFSNQIIYTTHSPFMVPKHQLDWVRTVNITEDKGTTVSNDPTGDARTLFPLQAALGYDLAQSLFVGANNLIVEGVTDFWILSAVSEYLNADGKDGLDERITITPAGGAQKVHYMTALLTSEQLNVLVLLDDEKEAKATRDDLVKGKLIRSDYVLFTSEAFDPAPPESDIEDILDPAVYERLVREAYAKELNGKALKPNAHIPRVAKRFETAFEDLGIPFHKTRPARLFLKKMATEPGTVVPKASEQQFERLFATINQALNHQLGILKG